MPTDREIIQVITKLNRLTQEGKLEWSRTKPPDSLTTGTDEQIFEFYCTTYKDRNIALYEERYQAYDDEYFHRSYWTSRLVLAFFSDDWEKEWEFPRSAGIFELLKSVQYQVADVDTFIDEILKDSDDGEKD